MRRFEFDPSWVVIRCLAAVGLVEIVGAPVRLAEPGVGGRAISGGNDKPGRDD
jgi:hypothetical protein